MPVFTGCVGAPLLGASTAKAVFWMGIRKTAAGAISPMTGEAAAFGDSPNSPFAFFPRRAAGIFQFSHFAEGAVPRMIRSASRAGRLPPRAAKKTRFEPGFPAAERDRRCVKPWCHTRLASGQEQ